MEAVPTYQYPCGRRIVVVGQWGHMLAHPSDCPDCCDARSITVYSVEEALRYRAQHLPLKESPRWKG